MHSFNPLTYAARRDLLRGRVILVTGASAGIGEAAARTFAAHGATVILHGRNLQRLERVYDAIAATGAPEPAMLPLDLAAAGERELANVEQTVRAQCGRLDGILHNAAHFVHMTALENERLDDWLRQRQTQEHGTARRVARRLEKNSLSPRRARGGSKPPLP